MSYILGMQIDAVVSFWLPEKQSLAYRGGFLTILSLPDTWPLCWASMIDDTMTLC